MCFGDSLTWGWVPVIEAMPTTRYPAEIRWTGILQRKIGDGCVVIEEGLNGRTTALNDPADPRLDGSAYLPSALASHFPLDLVIIMLGTNDLKVYFQRTSFEVATGVSKLVAQVRSSAIGISTTYPAPRVLIVAPPPLSPMPHPYFQSLFGAAHEKSTEFAKHFADLADFMKVDFFDAGRVITTDGVDGIHLTVENNRALGTALAEKALDIL